MQDDTRQHETKDPLHEMHGLIAAFLAGELTEPMKMRLEQLATEDVSARRLYLKYMFMFGKIHHQYQTVHSDRDGDLGDNPYSVDPYSENPYSTDPHWDEIPTQDDAASPNHSIFPLLDIEDDLLSDGDSLNQDGAPFKPAWGNASSRGFWSWFNSGFTPMLIVIIAATLILNAVVILPIYWTMQSNDLQWSAIARINKTVDCYWAQDKTGLQEGTLLTAGQVLNLELGLAEIEFTSGTKVVLEGPARFVVTGNNTSQLDLGQLTAVVPQGAEGFTVGTPNMEVIDLGTEFGVAVTTADSADIHVFKGAVEIKAGLNTNKQHQIRLKENEAIEYNNKSGDVVSIPADQKRFVRSLDRNPGVTANLRVTNPSFELPDIRTISEYLPEYGKTRFRPIYGWMISDRNPTTSQVATYQISPFTTLSNEDGNAGPGATDGRQVVAISLGVKPSPKGKPRSNWIYQSLGTVASDDVGKRLELAVDAGPRSKYANLPQGAGTVWAGFALHVTPEQSGTFLGKPASFRQEGEIKQLHRLEATVTITTELIGKELFILLAASDDGSTPNIDQYYFDNIQVR